MNKDKVLVLKDLSSRLPYSPIVHIIDEDGTEVDALLTTSTIDNLGKWVVKPYLRPMSSMTEEEKKEYDKFFTTITAKDANFGKWISPADDVALIDWYNKHHFDYRGLIEKGLAIAVTEENNPYKD